MDGLTFYKLMIILNKNLTGAQINSLTVLGGSVYFSLYKEKRINIEFRTVPAPPVLKRSPTVSGDSPGALGAVSGAVITRASSFGFERAGYIEFEKRRPSGKMNVYRAILEPAGNYANFFLLDSGGIILYSLSSRTIDPDRRIGAGNPYSRPRPNKKYSLDDFEGASSFGELAGFYPFTSGAADRIAEKKGFNETAAFIRNALENDDKFYISEKGKILPFPADENPETILWDRLGDYYRVSEKTADDSKVIWRLKKLFAAKKDKYFKLIGKLEEELNNAENAAALYEEAELLKANLHRMRGPGAYELQKYGETGIDTVSYEIKYGENMPDKINRLYLKASRLKKSIPLIRTRLRDAVQMAAGAEEQLYYLDSEKEPDDLRELERLVSSESGKDSGGRKPGPVKKSFYEGVLDGYRIFAGRSAASNYELVFRYAKDSDVWFHGRQYPSAHVILRPEGGAPVTSEIVEICARIAAGLSKKKNDTSADVDYTLRKYVKKPKNTPPGFVTYERFKTVAVRPFSRNELEGIFNFQ